MPQETPSILKRLCALLGSECYVGGKEAHTKYAFVAACIVAGPVVAITIGMVVSGAASQHRDLMLCLSTASIFTAMLGLGACISGFVWKGAWQWALVVCIVVLGSMASLAWWLLGILGWPHGVHGTIWEDKYFLAVMASWTAENIWLLMSLVRRRSAQGRIP